MGGGFVRRVHAVGFWEPRLCAGGGSFRRDVSGVGAVLLSSCLSHVLAVGVGLVVRWKLHSGREHQVGVLIIRIRIPFGGVGGVGALADTYIFFIGRTSSICLGVCVS